MDFKNRGKLQMRKKNTCFLHVFIIFGEPRKIQNRRQNERKTFVFCTFLMGSISPGSQRSMEPRENVVSRFHHFLINLRIWFQF